MSGASNGYGSRRSPLIPDGKKLEEEGRRLPFSCLHTASLGGFAHCCENGNSVRAHPSFHNTIPSKWPHLPMREFKMSHDNLFCPAPRPASHLALTASSCPYDLAPVPASLVTWPTLMMATFLRPARRAGPSSSAKAQIDPMGKGLRLDAGSTASRADLTAGRRTDAVHARGYHLRPALASAGSPIPTTSAAPSPSPPPPPSRRKEYGVCRQRQRCPGLSRRSRPAP